ncbi:MAG: hypothetical protein AUJ43_02615 [Parcubacteria group bacterium CG1_02_44_31]|nr:MAG: hypothetical protein AUJ43_02615 [Parcubacteria group bacterium CG1_02_44_31]
MKRKSDLVCQGRFFLGDGVLLADHRSAWKSGRRFDKIGELFSPAEAALLPHTLPQPTIELGDCDKFYLSWYLLSQSC